MCSVVCCSVKTKEQARAMRKKQVRKKYKDRTREGQKNPGRGKRFFPFAKRSDHLWGPHSHLSSVYQGSFLGVKRPGCEGDHSPPSSGKVTHE